MNFEKVLNIFMLRNINVIIVIINLEGIYKIKIEKNDNKIVFIFLVMKIY